ncbi:MAG: HlyD family efflux transporter periplasmic adaptor subunit [Candidatus Methanoplasma sp.]|jgi:multidrug resistance efflux pump|nr:HlyD family efflux transporter periplasmic adaptor subunit [Candidatus Methanoplasma sp.]
MRRFGEYDLSRMSDSRILYMRNPPKFAYIFTAVVVIALAVILIWSSFAVRAEQVESTGIIVTEDRFVIMPEVTGTITEINVKEGDVVEKGSVILSFDKTGIELEISALENEKKRLSDRIGYIDRMIDATNRSDPKQPFSNTGDQREFYAMFQSYRSNFDACGGDQDPIDSLNYQTRTSLLAERGTVSASLSNTDANLKAYKNNLSKYDITAVAAGTVHFDTFISKGMMLSAGTQIGSISSSESMKMIELYIPSYQRSRIEVGAECKFTVDGLPQTEYGSIRGRVLSISSDAIIQESGAFFKVIIEFDADAVEDSKGSEINLVNGMTVRTWITYEKMSYLNYWLEQIGLGDYF